MKISKAIKGNKHSDETKKKIKLNCKGKKLSDEHKKKIGDIHRGKKLSDETKKKISDSHKGIINRCCNYEIKYPNGEIKIIIGLKKWCIENNLNYSSVCSSYRYNRLYKGYEIKKINLP